jgi:hypothetical protein
LITRAQFAELALAMPEAAQASHFGNADFRVRNKIFANLDSAAERASLKVRSEIQSLLVSARPQAFVPAAGAWGNSGWTYVMLEHVELDEMRGLVADAWRLIAPARLVTQHAASSPGALELEVSPVVSPRGVSRSRRSASASPAGKRKRKATKRRRARSPARGA